MSTKPKVIVIGGGIIGAAIACELSKHPVDVLVLYDRDAVTATFGSFGWINAHDPENADYFRVRIAAMRQWQHLKQTHPQLPVRFAGSLDWDLADIPATLKQYAGFETQSQLWSEGQFGRFLPKLANAPSAAIFNPLEGVANPESIAQAFFQMADVEIEVRASKVVALGRHKTGPRVMTNDGVIDADFVVLATGENSAQLLKTLDIDLPMQNDFGVLIRTEPVEPMLPYVISSPALHFWQMDDGSLIAGENLGGGDDHRDIDAITGELVSRLDRFLPAADGLTLAGYKKTRRPMPADGFPVVSSVKSQPGLFVACMHSGVTLAPLVAQEIVGQIINGPGETGLDIFDLGRFETQPTS